MILAKNRRYVLVAPLGALLFIACKPEVTPASGRDYATKPKDPMSGFYASSQTEVRAKNNFHYAIFKKDYE